MDSSLRGGSRVAALAVAIVLIVIGLAMVFGLLLVDRGDAWEWSTKRLTDLEDAKINAALKGTTEAGVRLARQNPGRAVSLISPPLSLDDGVGRIVEVVASLPDAEASSDQSVVFLWQLKGRQDDGEQAGYQFERTQARLGPTPTIVRFSLTVPPAELHRIGFQFADAQTDVVIERMAFPTLGVGERVSLARSQWLRPEPFELHSINFLRGPSILGISVNSYLFGLLAIGVGLVVLVAAIRQRSVCVTLLIGVIVAVWAIEDARATWNLSRNAGNEIRDFANSDDRVETWTLAHGSPEIAWAADLLVENADAGSSFCVISDDDFAVPHRLAYLVAPRLSRTHDCRKADFIVVMFSSTARFDPDEKILTLPDESMLDARPVAQLTDYVYILKSEAK